MQLLRGRVLIPAYVFTAGQDKTVAASLGYPFIHYKNMDNAPAFVNRYRSTQEVREAFAEKLYGEIPFQGVSSVDLNV